MTKIRYHIYESHLSEILIILQGRCIWHNPVEKSEDEFEEEEEEEEKEAADEPKRETGPSLLTSVSDDERKNTFNLPFGWRVITSFFFKPRNNLWAD